MIRFSGGFISGQTGDMCRKPETEIEKVEKVEKVKKVGVPENGKWKISGTPMWFVNGGPYSFWF